MSAFAVPPPLAQLGIDAVVPFSVALTTRFRRVEHREGLLLHGPAGWGEWSPFPEYAPEVAARWLAAALRTATHPAPPARRTHVPVNVTVPAVDAATATAIVAASGARTAKVKVAEPGGRPEEDLERLAAVRSVLGPAGRVRIDANAALDLDTALALLPRMDEAAGGLEYVEQPCARLDELAEVRRRTGIAVAADESWRLAPDPFAVDLAAAADVLVVKLQPAGGIDRALRLAEAHGLPVVVSSALETSVGLAAGVLLAAALPRLEHDCGLGTALLLATDTVTSPLIAEQGGIAVERAAEVIAGTGPADAEARAAARPGSGTVAALAARLEDAIAALARLDDRGAIGPTTTDGPVSSEGAG